MSRINFKILVESVLLEATGPLANILTPPTSNAGFGGMSLKDALDKAERYGFEIGKYEKNGTIIGFKTSWPYIDVLAYIYKNLVDAGIVKVSQDAKNAILASLSEPQATTVKLFLDDLIQQPGTNTPSDPKALDQVKQNIQQKIDVLVRDKENYKDYFINRFKQLNDKTAIIAAEKYLGMTPYNAIIDLLKEYGGYDISLAKNIVEYPAETDYTIKSGASQDPVLATVVEISKLMLIFYREYIIEQKEVNAVINVPDLQVNNVAELKDLVVRSAGRKNVSGRPQQVVQTDYINFTKGKSALAIDPTVPPNPQLPLDPPVAIIGNVGDFQGMSDTGQTVYETFLQLFNSIKKGPKESGWKIAGNILGGFLKGLDDVGSSMGSFTRGL